jgi:hypothetical protein
VIVLLLLLTSVLAHLSTITLHVQQLLLLVLVGMWHHLGRHLSLGMISVDPKIHHQLFVMRAISVQEISHGRDQM